MLIIYNMMCKHYSVVLFYILLTVSSHRTGHELFTRVDITYKVNAKRRLDANFASSA